MIFFCYYLQQNTKQISIMLIGDYLVFNQQNKRGQQEMGNQNCFSQQRLRKSKQTYVETPEQIIFDNYGYAASVQNKYFQGSAIPENENQAVVSSNNDKRKLMQTNNRPYTAIGLLWCQFPGFSGFATGFLIRHNVLLTCAHNIYHRDTQILAKELYFTPGISAKKHKSYQVAFMYIPEQYRKLENGVKAKQFDFAMLILDTDQKLGQIHGVFQFTQEQTKIQQKQVAAVYGFPEDLNHKHNSNKYINNLFGCEDIIVSSTERRIIHKIDTNVGQSGSPIFRMKGNQAELLGIHTGKLMPDNQGVKKGRQLTQRIMRWLNQELSNERITISFRITTSIQTIRRLSSEQSKDRHSQIQEADRLYAIGLSQENQKFKINKVMALYQQALQIYERVEGNNSQGRAKILHSMGRINASQGKYQQALGYYKQSLVIKSDFYGKFSKQYAITLGGLGTVYGYLNNNKQARNCFNQSLKIKELKFGKQHLQCVKEINNIAVIESRQKNFDISIQLKEKALRILEKSYGEQSIECALSLNNLAADFRQKKNTKKAMQLLMRAKNIFEFHGALLHQNYALVFKTMGYVLCDQQKIKEAVDSWKESKKIFEQKYGVNNQNPHYKFVCSKLKRYS